jgi:hypothetical protein
MNISSEQFFSFAQIVELTPEEKATEHYYVSGVFSSAHPDEIECTVCDSVFPYDFQSVMGDITPVREAPSGAVFYRMKGFAPPGTSVIQSFDGVNYYLIENFPEFSVAEAYHSHGCYGL